MGITAWWRKPSGSSMFLKTPNGKQAIINRHPAAAVWTESRQQAKRESESTNVRATRSAVAALRQQRRGRMVWTRITVPYCASAAFDDNSIIAVQFLFLDALANNDDLWRPSCLPLLRWAGHDLADQLTQVSTCQSTRRSIFLSSAFLSALSLSWRCRWCWWHWRFDRWSSSCYYYYYFPGCCLVRPSTSACDLCLWLQTYNSMFWSSVPSHCPPINLLSIASHGSDFRTLSDSIWAAVLTISANSWKHPFPWRNTLAVMATIQNNLHYNIPYPDWGSLPMFGQSEWIYHDNFDYYDIFVAVLGWLAFLEYGL